jgi:apolipoprotein N-acyltransferase
VIKILIAIIAGGLNALAFAPFGWWPLGLLSIALMFSIWLISTPRESILSGLFFGLSLFGIGVSWMYISFNTYGGMPPSIAGFSIFLGIVIISLYPALCGWIQSLFSGWNVTLRLSILMPSLWILTEWLRGWLFTGFPWLSTGYAYLDTPLSNFAPIGGVYLVGYLALLSIGSLVAVLRHATVANGALTFLLIIVWVGGWQLNETAWTRAAGESVSVAIIQNNVPLSQKWDQQETNATIAAYMSRSQDLQDRDLIVWPEASVPDYLDNLSNEFWRDIEHHPADFIFGVLHKNTVEGVTQYYNSVAAVTDQIMIYRKQHLVPFGEYFPMQWLFGPLVRMLDIPMSDFTAWKHPQKPLEAAGNRFAVSICFEDAFPNEIRSQIAASGVLINVSEDVWFGDSFAPHQRLQMARFRSRETERPMIRSSNNGLSSLINWKGGVDSFAPQFVEYVVKGKVQPRTGITPYTGFGDSPVISLAGLFLLAGLIFGRLRSFRHK